MRKIEKRQTINGSMFSPGDYLIRVGRYFDRDASDTSGLTFEEWQPELVFTPQGVCWAEVQTIGKRLVACV